MYFVRYSPLKEKLRDHDVSDREVLPSLLVLYVWGALGSLLSVGGWSYLVWVRRTGAFVGLVNMGAVLYVYRANGGRRGHDLYLKQLILHRILENRILLVGVGVLAPVPLFVSDPGRLLAAPLTWVLLNFANIIFWQRLAHHIRDTRNESSEAEQGEWQEEDGSIPDNSLPGPWSEVRSRVTQWVHRARCAFTLG